LQRATGEGVERSELLARLLAKEDLLKAIELLGPAGQTDTRKSKKLREVAGFSELILKYVRQFLGQKDPVRVVEFSCGKSYLGIVLVLLLRELEGRRAEQIGRAHV
jgi:hypothetical protein